MKKKLFYGFLCILWMLVIFNFSSAQGEESSGLSDRIVALLHELIPMIPNQDTTIFLVRKLAHFSEYAILGMLYVLFLNSFSITVKKMVLLSVVCVVLYAASDEFHQLFIAGRSGQVKDVLIDSGGGCFGILLGTLLQQYLCKKMVTVDKQGKLR